MKVNNIHYSYMQSKKYEDKTLFNRILIESPKKFKYLKKRYCNNKIIGRKT